MGPKNSSVFANFEQIKKYSSHFADFKVKKNSSLFADFERIKKNSSHFTYFERSKKVAVILLTLNKLKKISSHSADFHSSFKETRSLGNLYLLTFLLIA